MPGGRGAQPRPIGPSPGKPVTSPPRARRRASLLAYLRPGAPRGAGGGQEGPLGCKGWGPQINSPSLCALGGVQGARAVPPTPGAGWGGLAAGAGARCAPGGPTAGAWGARWTRELRGRQGSDGPPPPHLSPGPLGRWHDSSSPSPGPQFPQVLQGTGGRRMGLLQRRRSCLGALAFRTFTLSLSLPKKSKRPRRGRRKGIC